ncbi:hypothetical protein [Brevibacillus laterosporus]|nr:hypothetical protein [Brevibacillus laterosporus]
MVESFGTLIAAVAATFVVFGLGVLLLAPVLFLIGKIIVLMKKMFRSDFH